VEQMRLAAAATRAEKKAQRLIANLEKELNAVDEKSAAAALEAAEEEEILKELIGTNDDKEEEDDVDFDVDQLIGEELSMASGQHEQKAIGGLATKSVPSLRLDTDSLRSTDAVVAPTSARTQQWVAGSPAAAARLCGAAIP